MTAGRLDFIIEKGAKFYRRMQLKNDDGTTRTLEGYVVKCQIRESYETSTILHELTEANGGIEVLDDPNASFAVSIDALYTSPDADYAVYDIIVQNEEFLDREVERVLSGKIIYSKGVTHV